MCKEYSTMSLSIASFYRNGFAITVGSFFLLGLGCGGNTLPPPPPCVGAECGMVCPAGTSVDYGGHIDEECNVSGTIQSRGIREKCNKSNGIHYVCAPMPGAQLCPGSSIDYITRTDVKCLSAQCLSGKRICSSTSQYKECYNGVWSPEVICPSDAQCFEGECVPKPQLDCNNLPPFRACGGSVAGHWAVSSSCINVDNGGCPTFAFILWGEISLDEAGNTTKNDLQARSVATYAGTCNNLPWECRPPMQGFPSGMSPLSPLMEDQSLGVCVKQANGQCVCTKESTHKPSKKPRDLPENGYCRRGDVLDLGEGALRVRFMRTSITRSNEPASSGDEE